MGLFESYIKYLNENVGANHNFSEKYGDVYFLKKKISPSHLKKRVLLFSHEMGRTGAPIVLFDVAKILKEMNYFVLFISLENGPLTQDIVDYGIPVIIDERMKDIEFDLSKTNERIIIDEFINDFSFSIFNTLVLFNFINHYKNTDNRIVWWIHEGTTIVDIPWLQQLLPKEIGNNIETYCVSEYSSNILKSRNFDYSQKIMPYGVQNVEINDNSQLVKDNDKFKMVCVGTFNERKGQRYLIDTIESSPASINNNVEYYFVGDATDDYGREQVNRLDKLIENNNFIFRFPSMKREELLKLFNSVDAIIVPSLDDPLPVVATECMMLKKIVICSDGTGTSSFIKDGESGYIFTKKSTESMKNAIENIISDKENYENIKEKAYDVYKRNFAFAIFKKNIVSKFIKRKLW